MTPDEDRGKVSGEMSGIFAFEQVNTPLAEEAEVQIRERSDGMVAVGIGANDRWVHLYLTREEARGLAVHLETAAEGTG